MRATALVAGFSIQPVANIISSHQIMNTSFNLKGEPIVNTPANAFNTFEKSEMDALVLENFIIEKPSTN